VYNPTQVHPLIIDQPRPEAVLCSKDPVLLKVISSQNERWSDSPDPDPIWGLIGVVISQQISTKAALTIRGRVAPYYPELVKRALSPRITVERLRACGVSPRKAECCASIATNAEKIYQQIRSYGEWEETLLKISGIGPWTLAIFRIFVLRQTDILPVGDLGLERAIRLHYPAGSELRLVSEAWKPYRSVACWYLWRSLGNPPLG
jgi:DNA-3-methyladenine glycosylase II